MTNTEQKKEELSRMHKPLNEWKNSSDPLERTVYFISLLSSHNYWKGYEALSQIEATAREEEYKRIMTTPPSIRDDIYITEWLRSVYGLDDDDTLNAGEIEELLESFVHDHKLTMPSEKEESK